MEVSFNNLSSDDGMVREVLELYQSAFPIDERRDVKSFMQILKEDIRFGLMACVGSESGCFYGFLSYWDFGEFCYIEHLAIVETYRGLGIGSAALSKFIDQVSSGIILEVEPPVDSITRRRVAFYESLGFELRSSFSYTQPPYSPQRNAVELKLMTYGEFAPQQIADAADVIACEVYRKYSSQSEDDSGE